MQNIGFDDPDGRGNSAALMEKTLKEVARLREQLDARTREFDLLKSKLSALESDNAMNGKSVVNTELEKDFR